MKEQYRSTSSNDTLSQQLELDLRVDDDIISTRACEGVSGSTQQVDAAVHLSEEDVPLAHTEASGARQKKPAGDEENTLKQEVSDDQIEEDDEEEFESIYSYIHQRVMDTMREELADAGVSKHRITMEEDLVEGPLDMVIDHCLRWPS